MNTANSLDPTIRSHLVTRRRRSVEDTSPLRSEELDEVQQDVGERVRSYLDFLKRVGNRDLQQAIAQHRATIVNGVQEGIVESTRRPTRAGEPPRRTRGMDIAKAALGQRPSFLVMDNEICLEGSLAHPSGWETVLGKPEVRDALRPRLAAVGLISDGSKAPVGTGFCLSPNLMMTNRHVAERIFDLGCQEAPGQFLKPRSRCVVNFSRDPSITSTAQKVTLALIKGLRFVSPEKIVEPLAETPGLFSQVDVAVMEVEPTPGSELPFIPLDLSVPELEKEIEVLVVGHPFEDSGYRQQFAEHQGTGTIAFDSVFGGQFQYKHAAPGYTKAYEIGTTPRLNRGGSLFQPNMGLVHDATTLGGNSGSPVLRMFGNNEALGIHFWGQAATKKWQIANLAHVLGGVIDARNHEGLLPHGRTLHEVISGAQEQPPGVRSAVRGVAKRNNNDSREAITGSREKKMNGNMPSAEAKPKRSGRVGKGS